MRHRDKKIKFRSGKDANKMLVRKLLVNFFFNGKIETTLGRAKVVKSLVDKLVKKIIVKNEANKNYLLKILDDQKLIVRLFKETGPILKDKPGGGYVKIVKLLNRDSDGADVARVEWVYPVLISKPNNKVKVIEVKKEEKKNG